MAGMRCVDDSRQNVVSVTVVVAESRGEWDFREPRNPDPRASTLPPSCRPGRMSDSGSEHESKIFRYGDEL